MPQYLLGIWQPDGGTPAPEVLADIAARLEAVTDEMKAKGVWVFSGGLHPASAAKVVRVSGDDVLYTDGPFAEGKEHLGGLTIVTAARSPCWPGSSATSTSPRTPSRRRARSRP